MKTETLRAVISNAAAFTNFILLIYSMLCSDKEGYVKTKALSMGITLVVYAVSGCWSSVITNIFSIGRDVYCLKAKKKRTSTVIMVILSGTLLAIVVNGATGTPFFTYLPAISFVIYSIGLFRTKTADQLKIVNTIDILLWIVYDYKNMLIVCVLQDIYIILMSIALQYVKYDTEEESFEG